MWNLKNKENKLNKGTNIKRKTKQRLRGARTWNNTPLEQFHYKVGQRRFNLADR